MNGGQPYWKRAPWHRLIVVAAVGGGGCQEPGRGPTLDDVDDQLVAVGHELVVNLRAVDPDGDAITYGFNSSAEGVREGASIASRPDGVGVFRWTPRASDVGAWPVDFTASDGGSRDAVTVTVEVRSALEGAAPIFREPLGSGTTLDLEQTECLVLPIVVEDQDDSVVVLGQEEPVLEGANLTQDSGTTGTWTWCPSKAQVADDRHPLVLSAADTANPKTLKNYLIVLRNAPLTNCPGDAPVVEHQTSDVASLLDISVTAEIHDDLGLKNAPLVYYTTTEPVIPLDFATLDLVEMKLLAGDMSGGTWSATLPNPVATAGEGATARLWYVISAGDNDDAQGECDHVTESPKGGAYAVTVTNPGGTGDAPVCYPCSADVQCGGAGDLCVQSAAASDRFCGSACETPADCLDATYTCAAVGSVGGVSAQQCVPVSGTCEGVATCDDDSLEENDTRQAAASGPPLPPGTHEGLVSCAADDDWYRIVVSQAGTVQAQLEGGTASNLNLGLYDAQGNPVAQSEAAGSSEVVEECVGSGTYYLRVYSLGTPATNGYELSHGFSAGSCAASCQDDALENDDNQDQAVYAEVFPDGFTSTDRTICAGDDDWHEIEIFSGETVAVDLTFVQSNFSEDLDLHLHNAGGVDLTPCTEADPSTCSAAQGQSASSNEHLEFTLVQGGCLPCTFYVRVHGFDGSENDYDISIALE